MVVGSWHFATRDSFIRMGRSPISCPLIFAFRRPSEAAIAALDDISSTTSMLANESSCIRLWFLEVFLAIFRRGNLRFEIERKDHSGVIGCSALHCEKLWQLLYLGIIRIRCSNGNIRCAVFATKKMFF